jgi:hypothetical protein
MREIGTNLGPKSPNEQERPRIRAARNTLSRQAVNRACSAFVIASPLEAYSLKRRAECVTRVLRFHRKFASSGPLIGEGQRFCKLQHFVSDPPSTDDAPPICAVDPGALQQRFGNNLGTDCGETAEAAIILARIWPDCDTTSSSRPMLLRL